VRDAAERRAQQVRGTVATQFATTADILEDMAAELELCEKFDFAAAQKIEEVLRLAGVQPIDVSCRTDRFGHMSVEAVAAPGDCVRLNRAQLAQEISRVCGRAFELPCVSSAGGKCRIRMDELPLYRAKTGCA
ncbi:MAG TPA: stage II sporulation protein E, partial [Ruminococcaceae bacterium]|nr:stage II sporulation protein E [Oscillospiraceae bacterium]